MKIEFDMKIFRDFLSKQDKQVSADFPLNAQTLDDIGDWIVEKEISMIEKITNLWNLYIKDNNLPDIHCWTFG